MLLFCDVRVDRRFCLGLQWLLCSAVAKRAVQSLLCEPWKAVGIALAIGISCRLLENWRFWFMCELQLIPFLTWKDAQMLLCCWSLFSLLNGQGAATLGFWLRYTSKLALASSSCRNRISFRFVSYRKWGVHLKETVMREMAYSWNKRL